MYELRDQTMIITDYRWALSFYSLFWNYSKFKFGSYESGAQLALLAHVRLPSAHPSRRVEGKCSKCQHPSSIFFSFLRHLWWSQYPSRHVAQVEKLRKRWFMYVIPKRKAMLSQKSASNVSTQNLTWYKPNFSSGVFPFFLSGFLDCFERNGCAISWEQS